MPCPVSWMPAVFPGPSSTVTAQEKDCAATGSCHGLEVGVLVWGTQAAGGSGVCYEQGLVLGLPQWPKGSGDIQS